MWACGVGIGCGGGGGVGGRGTGGEHVATPFVLLFCWK